MNLAGVQYKKILNDKKGFRLIAGYSSYNGPEMAFSRGTSGDTAVDRFTETNINLGIVGAGIEMQRHFYKKVYLFAALELRGGYGSGSHDTLVRKTSSSGMPYAFGTKEGRADATMVYVGLMPSIGTKLQFKKLTVGTELSGIESSYKQQRIENRSSYGVMDVMAGQFSQRIFVNYRF
jgi:hypothetical protein